MCSYEVRTGRGVWENQATRYLSLEWIRMRRAEKGLGHDVNMVVVLVLGRPVRGYLSGAMQLGK